MVCSDVHLVVATNKELVAVGDFGVSIGHHLCSRSKEDAETPIEVEVAAVMQPALKMDGVGDGWMGRQDWWAKKS